VDDIAVAGSAFDLRTPSNSLGRLSRLKTEGRLMVEYSWGCKYLVTGREKPSQSINSHTSNNL
jgi:hypothetical protein